MQRTNRIIAIWSVQLFLIALQCDLYSQQRDATKKPSITKKEKKEGDLKKPIKLPGLVVDFNNHLIDLDATVCLDKGLLELVACTKGSKEHESLVAVSARPMHIHTALLLLGSKNGNPAIRKRIGKEDQRWVELPPRGDPVSVAIVVQNKEGKSVERPINEFVVFGDKGTESKLTNTKNNTDRMHAATTELSSTFLFAGSILQGNGKGPRNYLAEKSGNVISIVTFGDELLCLPEVESHKNDALKWRVKPNQLPKVGTKVLLRLRPIKKNTKLKK